MRAILLSLLVLGVVAARGVSGEPRMETLRTAAAEADRVRVRSGGTCHRDPDEEKTLADLRGRAEVVKLLAPLEVDEPASREGIHCMCCGDPTFELYAVDRLVAMIGFHHGTSIRWDRWSGDAILKDRSADRVCGWLADHGIPGPQEERREAARREAALSRRFSGYRELVPEAVGRALEAARGLEDAIGAFEVHVTDPVVRAALYLRLLGVDQASWNLSAGIDETLTSTLLPRVDGPTLAAAGRAVLGDARGETGAARWLLYAGKHASLPPESRAELLAAVARRGLLHPRPCNRRYSMLALRSNGGDLAIGLLREVLDGKLVPRALSDEERAEPGGMVAFRSGEDAVDRECSDAALAALFLAEMGRSEIRPAIAKRLETATGEERTALEEALAALSRTR